jgi:hypothetical protein
MLRMLTSLGFVSVVRVRVVLGACVAVLCAASPAAAGGPPFAVFWSAPTPAAPQSPGPANGITGVSCAVSQVFCAAVDQAGHVETSTDYPSTTPTWTAALIDAGHHLTGVFCPSSSLCIATDDAGNVLTSTSPAGGAGAWTAASVDPGHTLTAIACASAVVCVATDDAGNVVTSPSPAGGAAAWTTTTVDAGHGLTAIGCNAPNLCFAVDGAGGLVLSTNPTAGSPTAWFPGGVQPSRPPFTGFAGTIDAGRALSGVSCASAFLCVAVDTAGDVVTSTDPTGFFDSPWTVTPVDTSPLRAISCSAVGICVAVGDGGHALFSSDPTGGAAAWTAQDVDPGRTLDAISCLPSCVAADDGGNVAVGSVGFSSFPAIPPLPAPVTSVPDSTPSPPTLRVTPTPKTIGPPRTVLPSGRSARIATLLKGHGCSLSVTAAGAGAVTISWYEVPPGAHLARTARAKTAPRPVLVARGQHRFGAAGVAKVKLTLTAAGARLLEHATKLSLTQQVGFVPAHGPHLTTTRAFHLSR